MLRILVAVAVVLAGCSGGSTPEGVSQDKGTIRGIVIDPSIAPVADVELRLKGTDIATTSDAEGAFMFTGLDPGPYFIEAHKAGYETTQTSTHVEVGRSPVVKIQIAPNLTTVAYALPATYTGWIACEALVGAFLQPCHGDTGAFKEPDNTIFLRGDDRPADAIQLETVWDAQQMVGERLTQTIGSCTGDAYCNPYAGENFLCQNWGASPLWCRVTANGGHGNGHFCCAEGLETQGHGKGTGTGVSVHLGADCSLCADPIDPAVGVGLVFEQEVTTYLWSFYHFVPDDDWLFTRDGPPVPDA